MLLKLTLMEEGGKKIKCRLLLSLLIPKKKTVVGIYTPGKTTNKKGNVKRHSGLSLDKS